MYTAALLRAIEVPGIRIEDVFKRVRKAVSEQTSGEQVPWEASSLIGDFTFALPVASTSPAAARPSAAVAGAIDEMVVVPAGEFWMGSKVEEVSRLKEECRALGETAARCKDWYEREVPRHRVMLDTFYIDRYEVANVLFERFVNARAHITTAEREGSGWSYVPRDDRWQWLTIPGASWRTPNGPGSEALAHHPVVQVSWRDAEAYCKWIGRRLPTEAEWEKAARGSDERRYPWGDTWSYALGETDWKSTTEIGRAPDSVSPYGAHDMARNVWEWVSDWFDSTYYQRSTERNPVGPATGERKVMRGGSWARLAINSRTAFRNSGPPDARYNNVGFRCAKDATR